MRTLPIIALLFILMAFAVNPLKAQNGADVFAEPFYFVTNDGCGDYYVYGTVKIIYRENGENFIYEGTAVEVATGDAIPLHVNVAAQGNNNGYHSILQGVFPSQVIFHTSFQVKATKDGLEFKEESWVKCK